MIRGVNREIFMKQDKKWIIDFRELKKQVNLFMKLINETEMYYPKK